MTEDNTVYSTAQLGTALGLGTAMVRKYAVALEQLTGEEIPIKRRDGRQFGAEHFRIISAAKSLIDSNKGLTVDLALRMALTPSQMPADGLAPVGPSNSEAITAETILEGIRELKAIRLELVALREQVGNQLPLNQPVPVPPEIKIIKSAAANEHGLIVRLAVQVEGWLKRFR